MSLHYRLMFLSFLKKKKHFFILTIMLIINALLILVTLGGIICAQLGNY